jgi:integrator complex subunit 9
VGAQTCLGEGKGGEKGGLLTPPCFSLDFCHTRILLECPLDLSALLQFLPSALPSFVDQGKGELLHSDTLPSSSTRSSTLRRGAQRDDVVQPDSKRQKTESVKPLVDGPKKSHYKSIGGQYLLDAEPWYKTPDFNVVDVTSLNAVIVSNPVAMLGLPLLTRHPHFTAKVHLLF